MQNENNRHQANSQQENWPLVVYVPPSFRANDETEQQAEESPPKSSFSQKIKEKIKGGFNSFASFFSKKNTAKLEQEAAEAAEEQVNSYSDFADAIDNNSPKTITVTERMLPLLAKMGLAIECGQELSEKALKKAFRKKALVDHPDKGGDAELFKASREAYEKIANLFHGGYLPEESLLDRLDEIAKRQQEIRRDLDRLAKMGQDLKHRIEKIGKDLEEESRDWAEMSAELDKMMSSRQKSVAASFANNVWQFFGGASSSAPVSVSAEAGSADLDNARHKS